MVTPASTTKDLYSLAIRVVQFHSKLLTGKYQCTLEIVREI